MKSWSEAISVDDQKFLWILFKHEMPSNPPCRTAYCRGGIYINNMVMNMNSSICRWFVRVLFFFLTENHHLREPFCFYVQSKTLRHLNNCMPYLDLIIFYPCVGDEQNSIAKKISYFIAVMLPFMPKPPTICFQLNPYKDSSSTRAAHRWNGMLFSFYCKSK